MTQPLTPPDDTTTGAGAGGAGAGALQRISSELSPHSLIPLHFHEGRRQRLPPLDDPHLTSVPFHRDAHPVRMRTRESAQDRTGQEGTHRRGRRRS